MSNPNQLMSPPRRVTRAVSAAARAAPPAFADPAAAADVPVASTPNAELASVVLAAHAHAQSQVGVATSLTAAVTAISTAFAPVVKMSVSIDDDALSTMTAAAENIITVINDSLLLLSISISSTTLPPPQHLPTLALHAADVIRRSVQTQAGVAGARAQVQRSKLLRLATIFAVDGMIVGDASSPHAYSPLNRPWANAVRQALGAMAPVSPAITTFSIGEWLDVHHTALAEANSALLDTAAMHIAANVEVARATLTEDFTAALAGLVADAPALAGAMAAGALDASAELALSTVAATADTQLLRQLIRHVDMTNSTPDRKKAFDQLCSLTVPAGSTVQTVLADDDHKFVRKLRLTPADRISPAGATSKGGAKGAHYTEVVAGFDSPLAAPSRLLVLPVTVGATGSPPQLHLVDTNASVNVASIEYLRALPADAVRAPIGDDGDSVTATGWDGSSTSALSPGWHVQAVMPWAPSGAHWFPVHASAARPLFGPFIWGMPALRQFGATLHIGMTPADDAATPLKPQICAVSVAPPVSSALGIVLSKIASNEYLAAFPMLRARLADAAGRVLWASKAYPLSPLPPPIRGALLTTRLKPGMPFPEFKARMRDTSRPQYAAVLAALPTMMSDGSWLHVRDDRACVTSPLMAAPKYNVFHEITARRVCGDWRQPNAVVLADCELLPRVGDLISHGMVGPVRTLFDAARAYNQIDCCPLTQVLYCVQATDEIKLMPLRAQFGMKNAGSTCHRAIRDILCSTDAGRDPAAMNYSDEIVLHTDTFRYQKTRPGVSEEECAVDEVCAVLVRAAAAGFVLQADKLQLLQREVNLCGIIVGPHDHRLPDDRMQAIAAWPRPSTPSRLISFLAMAAHWREYIPSFANDCGELRRHVLDGRHLKWSDAGAAVFERIRAAFGAAASLRQIDYNAPFVIKADMCIDGLSASLHQPDSAGQLHLVACNGRATRPYERNYGPMDLEAAAILFAIERYPYLLIGGPHAIEVRTDNKPLADFWTFGAQLTDPARADLRHRLIAKLQGYNITWVWNPATDNVWDDTVSRAGWHVAPEPAVAAEDHVALCAALFDDSQLYVAGLIDGTSSDDDADDDDDADASFYSISTAAGASAAPPSPALAAHAPPTGTHGDDDASSSAASTTVINPDDDEYAPSPPQPHADTAGAATAAADLADASLELKSSSSSAPTPTAAAPPTPPPAVSAAAATAAAAAAHATAAHADADALRRATTTRLTAAAHTAACDADTSAECSAWAAAQADDPALRRYFDAATGVATPVRAVTAHAPSLDRHGRLFVRFGPTRDGARTQLLAVPAALVSPLVYATHAAMQHRSATSVLAELRRTHWWPAMHADVARIVAHCIVCQIYTRRARETAPGSAYPPSQRLRAVHVDFVPMPPVTADGATYCGFLLAIDRATGMARFSPVTSKSGAALAAALERDWISHFGPPATLTADNALETRGKHWRALCAKHKITAVQTTSYNKQANGLVERLVQTVKRGVVASMHNNGDRSWLADLPAVLFSYICATQPARGHVSPFELTYGMPPPSTTGTPIALDERSFSLADGPQVAHAAHAGLQGLTAAAAAAQAATAAARTPEMQFAVGQVVFLENTDAAEGGTALAQRQRRFGPYIVAAVDPLLPRVQLRVLATGRVVRDKLNGQLGPYWVATRRLTLVQGDATQPGAGWLGAHDRGALPAGERADQLAQDRAVARSPKMLQSLRVQPAQCRGIAVGTGKVAAVVGHFNDAQAGQRVIIVLDNGYATDVSADAFPSLLTVAKHIPGTTKAAQIRAAPHRSPASSGLTNVGAPVTLKLP